MKKTLRIERRKAASMMAESVKKNKHQAAYKLLYQIYVNCRGRLGGAAAEIRHSALYS